MVREGGLTCTQCHEERWGIRDYLLSTRMLPELLVHGPVLHIDQLAIPHVGEGGSILPWGVRLHNLTNAIAL